MSFIQIEFIWLLVIVFGLYWTIGKRYIQNIILVISSAIFYGWVHPWFLILLYSSAVLDFTMGQLMVRYPKRKGIFLIISMCGNLGMLGYFKYCDFFVGNVVQIFETLGVETSLHTLGIFLPVGISFYTFQTMSYTIDIYRGQMRPRANFLDYLVFVSFFPQLVAGPVERASRLLPQVERDRTLDWDRFSSGMGLAMWGGFKKVVVADTVAPYVDKIFIATDPSSAMIAAATIGFSIQILADFSGYTDIARGTSRMLGFELMENFRNPYLATTPSQLWRRWHISFSTWIRDYVYITFGGSRGTFASMTFATFAAMLLSGLWHGAAWTFVLWGGYHAALLTGYRLAKRRIPKEMQDDPTYRWVTIPLMYFFTCFGWLLFRETHINRLLFYFTLNPFGGSEEQWIAAVVMLAVCLFVAMPLFVALFVEHQVLPKLQNNKWYLPIRTTTWSLLAVVIFVFWRGTNADFIYFQF